MKTLSAGAAIGDITPWAGAQLAGHYGRKRPAKTFLDPLFTKALVVQAGDRKLCVVSMDVTLITRPWADRIRRAAAEKCGIPYGAVMVHVVQNHNAPSVGECQLDPDFGLPEDLGWLSYRDDEYCEFVVQKTVEAIVEADRRLAACRMGAGSGYEARVAFNRRAVKRDGTIEMPLPEWPGPEGRAAIRYMEGPIDPEVGVVAFESLDGKPLAELLHYTCHPVHLFREPRGIVSADWPGAWSDEMARGACNGFVPMVINGACGNINPWNPFDPDWGEDHLRMGRLLAGVAKAVQAKISYRDEAEIGWATRTLKIPLREIPEEELATARRRLAQQPRPVVPEDGSMVSWEWWHAAMLQSVQIERDRSPFLDYEIQILRIGDVALVGLPGEPFAEGGLRIKMESPTFPTYIVHCVNQYAGYLPIREAFEHGGHETLLGPWSKMEHGALDTVVRTSIEMLREMFQASEAIAVAD